MNLGSKYKGHVFKCHDRQSYRCGFCEVEDVYVRFLKDGETVNAFVGLKSCSNSLAFNSYAIFKKRRAVFFRA